MKCDLSYKKVEVDYVNYSATIRVKCPFCESQSTRTRTYKSLKQLTFHLADQHQNEGNYYPFELNDIRTLMQTIAIAKKWRLLP